MLPSLLQTLSRLLLFKSRADEFRPSDSQHLDATGRCKRVKARELLEAVETGLDYGFGRT